MYGFIYEALAFLTEERLHLVQPRHHSLVREEGAARLLPDPFKLRGHLPHYARVEPGATLDSADRGARDDRVETGGKL